MDKCNKKTASLFPHFLRGSTESARPHPTIPITTKNITALGITEKMNSNRERGKQKCFQKKQEENKAVNSGKRR